MDEPEDKTPGAIPQIMLAQPGTGQHYPTLPQGIPLPPPPQKTVLVEWWKQLIAFLGGVIVFGTVAFFVAKTFFVPREEATAQNQAISEKLNILGNKIDNLANKVGENSEQLEKFGEAIYNIDLVIAAEGLSIDSPRARRIERQRRQRRPSSR